MHDSGVNSASQRQALRPIPPRFWWLKRALLATGILIFALVTLRWYWGYEAERRLQARIDEYRALGQPVTIDDFQLPPVPDQENAAHFLQRATAALSIPPNVAIDLGDTCGDLKLVAERADDVATIVAANAETLDLARQARSKPGAEWKFRVQSAIATPVIQERSAQRQLARLLGTAATYHHYVGDDRAAIQTLHDSLGHAMTVRRMPGPLIAELTAQAIDVLAIMTVEVITPNVRIATEPHRPTSPPPAATLQDVRALITALLNETQRREGWRLAMYGERCEALDLIDLVGRGAVPGPGNVPSLGPVGILLKPMFQNDALLIMDYYSALADAGSEPSFAAVPDRLPPYPSFDSGIEREAHFLSRDLLPTMDHALELHFRAIAMRRMAAVALALRLYEVDHGQRPPTLADLVPAYLPAVPLDPFAADGRTMGYLPDVPKPILFCMGPDCVDDGGVYALRDAGGVDWDAKDLVFFLDGDRPTGSPPSSTQPAATQAIESEGDEVSGDRQADQDPEEADADD